MAACRLLTCVHKSCKQILNIHVIFAACIVEFVDILT